jgi:site-specific recombinase XerD
MQSLPTQTKTATDISLTEPHWERPNVLPAKKSRYLFTVLPKEEIQDIIQRLSDEHKLLVHALYSTGSGLTESLSLRIKDMDFSQQQITAVCCQIEDNKVIQKLGQK